MISGNKSPSVKNVAMSKVLLWSFKVVKSSKLHHTRLNGVANESNTTTVPFVSAIALRKLLCDGSSDTSACKLCWLFAYAQTQNTAFFSRRALLNAWRQLTKCTTGSPHQWLTKYSGTWASGLRARTSTKLHAHLTVAGIISRSFKWYKLTDCKRIGCPRVGLWMESPLHVEIAPSSEQQRRKSPTRPTSCSSRMPRRSVFSMRHGGPALAGRNSASNASSPPALLAAAVDGVPGISLSGWICSSPALAVVRCPCPLLTASSLLVAEAFWTMMTWLGSCLLQLKHRQPRRSIGSFDILAATR
mmetsp:Transcript_125152/g.359416  ORF Transcript_125152/g.359416 Transcript_125152/m.359416 type:complete len:302 (+) Transcript_125152:1252-2157(+)